MGNLEMEEAGHGRVKILVVKEGKEIGIDYWMKKYFKRRSKQQQ